jgi:hypothetical protein
MLAFLGPPVSILVCTNTSLLPGGIATACKAFAAPRDRDPDPPFVVIFSLLLTGHLVFCFLTRRRYIPPRDTNSLLVSASVPQLGPIRPRNSLPYKRDLFECFSLYTRQNIRLIFTQYINRPQKYSCPSSSS